MQTTRHCRHLLAGSCLLLIAGCALSSKSSYQTPAVSLPPAWHHGTDQGLALPSSPWWQRFGDAELNRLVAEVLATNNNLAAATIVSRRARIEADLADSALLPSISAQGNASISRGLGDSELGEVRNLSLATAVSWEGDLWGRLGSRADAADWQAAASDEDREATALSLIATGVTAYWQLAYLNQRLALSEASIATAARTLELVLVERAAGAAATLEVLEAKRGLAAQRAAHTTLLQEREEVRQTLALLCDGPPRTLLAREPQSLASLQLPAVDSGLPADLLGRRPDLRAAEARLRAVLAETDSVRASYYPSLILTGNLGSTSAALQQLLRNPIATLGAQLTLPFLQWRDMQRNIQISEAAYEEAILRFRQTLYTALAEVERALSAGAQLREQERQLLVALEAASRVEAIYRLRYQAGSVPLRVWLDAQENRRQAEIALAQNRFSQAASHVTLCKALGGDPRTFSPSAPPMETQRPER